MRKLSAQERLVIYEQALEDYNGFGLCRTMNEVMQKIYPEHADYLLNNDSFDITKEMPLPDPFYHMQYFPEIYKEKPLGTISYWFPLDDNQSRLDILEAAIAEIKHSIKTS